MNFIMGPKSQIYIELKFSKGMYMPVWQEIKPMAQEIPDFSENFIYLSPPVSLKLG